MENMGKYHAERLSFERKGYSIKNWDDDEVPIVLLGSVFDANSLGMWIFDWTVYCYGRSTPMVDLAGDLWLHMIKLAGKTNRAEEGLSRLRIRSVDSRQTLDDFVQSGNRLWREFKQILEACEEYMWPKEKRDGRTKVLMGNKAGIRFVDCMFGRDRELENVERLMNSIRLWNKRFDANCESILGIGGGQYREEKGRKRSRSTRRIVVCGACGSTLDER